LHASIEQAKTAFENGNLPLAKNILSQQSDKSYQKYLYLALIASTSGKLDKAEKYIEKTIELNAKGADVQFTYAEIMAKQAEAASIFTLTGYIKKVKKAFIAAVELNPENIKYRRALIQFHINAPGMLGGNIDEALKHAQELKRVDALSGTIALIQVYGQMGDDDKFDEELKKAVLNFVNEPELYYQLGLYYQENESFNEALIYFRKAANMATATEKQQNAKYSAIFQLGRTSILSDSNFVEGKEAFIRYLNESDSLFFHAFKKLG
jgi:tetratricopeptide (TPR) repeat protein